MKLFAVYDLKAQHYIRPFTDESTINALRGFETAVNEGSSDISKYPDDFCLMELATFDRETGKITSLESPLNLGSARTVVRRQQPSVDMVKQ